MRSTPFVALAVATWAAAGAATASAAPPDNDNFAHPTRLPVGQELSGSLGEATVELGEAAGPLHTVWFRYRAAHDAPITVDTGGSAAWTVLAAYTGSELDKLHQIALDGGSSPTGMGSTVRFKAKRGHVYRISVGNYDSQPNPDGYKIWLSDGSVGGKGVTMAIDAGQTVDSLVSDGLHARVEARRRVRVSLALRVSRHVARHLGLSTRVIGRASGPVDYGQSLPATVQLSRKAKRALDGEPHLKARLRLTIVHSKAPNRVLTVPVTL
jgi:hypothetical protein